MWIAVLVFLISYIAISTENFPRHWVSLLGGSLLILTGVLSPTEALAYVNWETLGF
jgi:Na+/H+ antiporter NhaD/arsenite permease-like protein